MEKITDFRQVSLKNQESLPTLIGIRPWIALMEHASLMDEP